MPSHLIPLHYTTACILFSFYRYVRMIRVFDIRYALWCHYSLHKEHRSCGEAYSIHARILKERYQPRKFSIAAPRRFAQARDVRFGKHRPIRFFLQSPLIKLHCFAKRQLTTELQNTCMEKVIRHEVCRLQVPFSLLRSF
jgi:hypothetical protein